MRLMVKSCNANFMVGSACNGMFAFKRLRYIPAIIGFSSLLEVSSSMMLAKIYTSSGVRSSAFAFASLCSFQKILCS